MRHECTMCVSPLNSKSLLQEIIWKKLTRGKTNWAVWSETGFLNSKQQFTWKSRVFSQIQYNGTKLGKQVIITQIGHVCKQQLKYHYKDMSVRLLTDKRPLSFASFWCFEQHRRRLVSLRWKEGRHLNGWHQHNWANQFRWIIKNKNNKICNLQKCKLSSGTQQNLIFRPRLSAFHLYVHRLIARAPCGGSPIVTKDLVVLFQTSMCFQSCISSTLR